MSETWFSIATDPNHIVAELLWSVVFDGVVIALGYNVLIKKVILPKLHKEFDKQHGLTHKGEK